MHSLETIKRMNDRAEARELLRKQVQPDDIAISTLVNEIRRLHGAYDSVLIRLGDERMRANIAEERVRTLTRQLNALRQDNWKSS